MDDETLRLILQLQLADLEDLGDTALAAAVGAELSDQRTTIADRRICQSIASAVQTDGVAVADATRDEPQAAQAGAMDDETLSKLPGLYVSQTAGLQLQNDTQASVRNCTVCGDEKSSFEVVQTSCQHPSCRDCLRELFELSFKDESLFPPQCCHNPFEITGVVAIFLNKKIKDTFEEKRVEFSSPNRTYCSNSSCSKFIHPDHITADVASCLSCGERTCSTCKAPEHPGDCPQDVALQVVKDLAAREGWRQCNSCRRILELTGGCYHMTCQCNHQFCYLCGAEWKTCACVQWDEERLFARADEIVRRDAFPYGRHRGRREARVLEIAEGLREGHNCNHERWTSRRGEHQCELCHDLMPEFIYECHQCRFLACRRCRRHRL